MRTRSALVAALVILLGWAGDGWAAAEELSAKCLVCHGAAYEAMSRRPHAVAADSRNVGCIGCHGISEKHAENPGEAKPDQVSAARMRRRAKKPHRAPV
jgi:hypothetical protein